MELVIIAAYLALSFGIVYNPEAGLAVSSFTREIGACLVADIDISARISHMVFYGFLLVPLLFAGFYFVLKLADRRFHFPFDDLRFVRDVILVSSPALLLAICNNSEYQLYKGNYIPLAIVIGALLLSALRSEELEKTVFASVACLPPAAALLHMSGHGSMIMLIPAYVVILLAIHFLKLYRSAFPLFIIPLLSSLFLEGCNVLNQHNVFVFHKALWLLLISALCLAVCIFLGRKGKDLPKRFAYPVLEIGMALLAFQPVMSAAPAAELMESSNSGLAAYGLFNFGQLPIIENLDAHMLSNEIGRWVFYIFNGSAFDALWYEYSMIFVRYLLYYYLLRELLGSESRALMMTLLFPIALESIFDRNAAFGVLCILCALYALKSRSWKSYSIFFISCVLVCFYRMDVGVSFAVSSAVLLLLYSRGSWKKYFVSGIIVALITVINWCILCRIKGIAPLPRALEFFDIMASNIRWNRLLAGETGSLEYAFCYVLLPLGVVASAAGAFIKSHRNPDDRKALFIALCLALAYVLGFQRGITRHNLQEHMVSNVVSCSVLAISAAVYVCKNRRLHAFVIPFASLLLLTQLVFGVYNLSGRTAVTDACSTLLSDEPYAEYSERVDRIVITDDFKDLYSELKDFFDEHLEPNQTFIDFSDSELLYALCNREKPFYLNQAPSNLNREYSQRMFVEELSSYDCPYAITANPIGEIDGIPLFVTHYLAFEYLYENYAPVCEVGRWMVWERGAEQELSPGEYAYHLGIIPLLWAQYDETDEAGEYLTLHVDDEANKTGYIYLLDEKEAVLSTVSFDVRSGERDYIIRLSADPNWSLGLAADYRFELK